LAKLEEHYRGVGRNPHWSGACRTWGTIGILTLLVLTLFVEISAGTQTKEPNGPTDIFARGMSLYRSGDRDQALPLLLDYVSANPKSPQCSEAALAVARIYSDRGQYGEALGLLNRIPEKKRGPEARYLQGLAEIKVGRVEKGIAQLNALDETAIALSDRAAFLEALADGHRYLGHWTESLFFFYRALPLAPDEEAKQRYLRQTGELIANQLNDDQLAEASFLFAGSPIGQQVDLESAERYFRAGNTRQALIQVAKALHQPTDFPGRNRAVQLRERLAGSQISNRVLGVILPLSGRYASFGKLVQRGVELASQDLLNGEQAVRLVFKDSAADPQVSARAVSELANVDQVMGILGPLSGAAAVAAAERAELEKVPLLALSQRKGLAETGPYVFRTSLTNEQQARTLVRYVMEERGMTKFAILAPENRLGQEMSDAFIREVQAYGGQIVARQSYADKATDFRRQIKLLKGENSNAPEEKPRPEPDQPTKLEEEPELPFEALFIPDYADRVGLIVPQLPFYGIRNVQLLGINGWNSGELLRRGGAYVEGAVFVDGFFRHSDYPFVKDFVNRCFEKYGEEPTILEAQGYDGAGILLSLAARADVRSREDLRNALSIMRNYPGLTGATSFDLDGDARKVLFLLQVRDGAIVQIN
jgi:branched-chain amino acid transport system substrate-binding protein